MKIDTKLFLIILTLGYVFNFNPIQAAQIDQINRDSQKRYLEKTIISHLTKINIPFIAAPFIQGSYQGVSLVNLSKIRQDLIKIIIEQHLTRFITHEYKKRATEILQPHFDQLTMVKLMKLAENKDFLGVRSLDFHLVGATEQILKAISKKLEENTQIYTEIHESISRIVFQQRVPLHFDHSESESSDEY